MEISRRLSSLNLDSTRETEIIEELSQHLDDRYHELISGGVTEEDARRAVLMELKYENLLAQELPGGARGATGTSGTWNWWKRLLCEPRARPALRTPPVPAQPWVRRWWRSSLSGLVLEPALRSSASSTTCCSSHSRIRMLDTSSIRVFMALHNVLMRGGRDSVQMSFWRLRVRTTRLTA